MPLHVMANFGGFLCVWPGRVRVFAYHVVLFWGCVCDAVHQPHQPAEGKPSIRYRAVATTTACTAKAVQVFGLMISY